MRTKDAPGTMAAWRRLRELAELRPSEGLAVSLYVGFDPRVTPTGVETETRLRSLLDRARRSESAGEALTRAQRAALDADLERIARHAAAQLADGSGKSLAVFASELDGIFETVEVPGALPDDVRVGRRFYLVPLAGRAAREETALLAVVGREQGRIYTLAEGRLEELADLATEQPRRHDQGGWQQSKLQRWTDGLADEHLKQIAAAVDAELREREGASLVVAGPKELTSAFVGMLGQEARSAVAGEVAPGGARVAGGARRACRAVARRAGGRRGGCRDRALAGRGHEGGEGRPRLAERARRSVRRAHRAPALRRRGAEAGVRVPGVRQGRRGGRGLPARRDAAPALRRRARPRRPPHPAPWRHGPTRPRPPRSRPGRRGRGPALVRGLSAGGAGGPPGRLPACAARSSSPQPPRSAWLQRVRRRRRASCCRATTIRTRTRRSSGGTSRASPATPPGRATRSSSPSSRAAPASCR